MPVDKSIDIQETGLSMVSSLRHSRDMQRQCRRGISVHCLGGAPSGHGSCSEVSHLSFATRSPEVAGVADIMIGAEKSLKNAASPQSKPLHRADHSLLSRIIVE